MNPENEVIRRQKGPVVGLRNLSSYPDETLELEFSEKDVWLFERLKKEVPYFSATPGSAKFHVKFVKNGKNISFQGDFRILLVSPCDRCAKPFEQAIKHSFDLMLLPAPTQKRVPKYFRKENGPEGERDEGMDGDAEWGYGGEDDFVSDEANSILLQGEEIDLSHYLMEQVFLAQPMRNICRNSCPGLCFQCGADLSEGECDCVEIIEDNRWQALRNFKPSGGGLH